jgi:tetratricopeptide (TPR) repeat protein
MKLPRHPLFEVTSMLNCGKCGASLTEQALYCSMCGHQVGAAPRESTSPAGSPAGSPADSPLKKAASALAKASGLAKSQANPRFGFLVRTLSVVAGVILALSAYLVYRNQSSAGSAPVLNIVAPLDKFNRLVQAGKLSAEQGDFSAAIANFEEAEKLVPTDTDVIKRLADAYDTNGQVDNAVAKYSRVIELDPKNVEARYQRAEIQITRGLWKEAIEDLQYLAINAAHTEQGNLARQILGGNFTVKRTIESLSNKHGLLGRRGKRGLQLPEVDETPPELALTLPQLVGGIPDTPPAPLSSSEEYTRASILAKQHRRKGEDFLNARYYYSAIKELQSARQLAADDSDLNYLLGQAYFGLKQYAQARKYYEQCDSGVYVQVARSAAQKAREYEQKQAKKARKEEKSDD